MGVRILVVLAVGLLVIATACSSGSSGFQCCSVTLTGGGLSSICLCQGSKGGGCTLDSVGATMCTIKCSGAVTGTFSGTPREMCTTDGG